MNAMPSQLGVLRESLMMLWPTITPRAVPMKIDVSAMKDESSRKHAIAAAAITGTPWLPVVGVVGHGLKDLWQHHSQFVANKRWWPPFCLVVDWVVAAIIAVEIVAGVHFHV